MNNPNFSEHPIHAIKNDNIRSLLLSRYFKELVTNLTLCKEQGDSFIEIQDSTLHVLKNIGDEHFSPVVPISYHNRESNTIARELRYILTQQLSEKKTPQQIEDFFLTNNVHLKIALGQRTLATAGVNLEPLYVDSSLPGTFLTWLKERFNVVPGDIALHRHVHGESMQNRLYSLGLLAAPYTGWHRHDYTGALDVGAEIMYHNTMIKGIISEGSWIYDPSAHDTAPDGRPYLAASFMKHDHYTGHRKQLPKEELGAFYATQLMFASKNARRKQFIEEGVWTPQVYGAFYPRDEVLQYVHRFRL